MVADRIDEELWDISHDGFCGVLVPRKVMQKVIRERHRYIQRLREILIAHQEELYDSEWTMSETERPHYLYFTRNDKATVDHRLKNIFKTRPFKKKDEVYLCKDYAEAKAQANAIANSETD